MMRKKLKIVLVTVTLLLSGLGTLTQPEISNSLSQHIQMNK